jgi:putative Ca2+/H+ antiporter (TMEM165/GDT1 family)
MRANLLPQVSSGGPNGAADRLFNLSPGLRLHHPPKLRREKMDWRVMLTTFGVVFLAEMGDKTQLAAMTMAAQSRRPWSVLFGASLALVCVSALGVAVGGLLGEYLPLVWIKGTAALAFIVIGVLMLAGKL